jgi:hypothetical protein
MKTIILILPIIFTIFSSNVYADYYGTSQNNTRGRINESNRGYIDKKSTDTSTYNSSPSYSDNCACVKSDTSGCNWGMPLQEYKACINNAPCLQWTRNCN